MALGAPKCMGLLIEKSTVRMLMFIKYLGLGPRPCLGCTKLRTGPQDTLERWCFQKEPPSTKQKYQTIVYC